MSPGHPAPLDPEQLLAEDRFVRGLARQLLRDPHGAEDLAQQTWVAAMRQPAAPSSLRAWLAAIVRRLASRERRGRQRDRSRQQAVARPDLVPSAEQILAREALRGEVVRAVLALDEPYRAVVLLRWFDNLPPRAIARRLELPVETVRTRHKRAMAQLRQRLDRHTDGGRAAWCALLLPFAKWHTGSAVAAAAAAESTLAGVLAMTTKTKLAAVAAALGGALLITVWSLLGPPGSAPEQAPPAANVVADPAGRPAPPAALGAADASSAPVVREAVAAAPLPTTGSLLVHVVWGDDKQPAAGVVVEAYRAGGDGLFENQRARSDERGEVRFAGLAPGRAWPTIHRGETMWGNEIDIVAGQQSERTMEVEIGMNVRGRVVDGANRPVAGADIMVAGWGGGESQPLERSAADGTFAIRALATHCHVGARAAGHAPSPMRQFTAGKGADVEFTIVLGERGASLAGVVLDPEQRPVEGAVVQVGDEEQRNRTLPDGGWAMGPQPQRTRTDVDGRFLFASVESGDQPLAVRARGLAPTSETVAVVEGRQAQVTVRLQAGVTLVGTVRDAAGNPVAKAEIEVGDWRRLERRNARSDAAGAFRLDGLGTGESRAQAASEQHGKAETTVHGAGGATVRWDPVLQRGLQLRGRVLDVDGKPVASAMVEGQLARWVPGKNWFAFDNTDGDGRFTFPNCEAGQAVKVMVRRKSTFTERTVTHVPDAGELEIRLPKEAWIHIQGSVLDPDGKAVANVHLSPAMKGGGGSPAETPDPKTGAFDLGPYPPGEYCVSVHADGFARLRTPWRTVAPDEVWDLGTLRLQRGGSLVVNLIADGPPAAKQQFSIHDEAGEHVEHIEVAAGTGRAGPLRPGRYQLQLHGDGIACAVHPFEIRADVETRLDVPVHAGIAAVIECALPAGDQADGGVQVVVADGRGEVVARGTVWASDGRASWPLTLRPGDYRVEASRDGRRGDAALSVAAPGPAKVSIALR